MSVEEFSDEERLDLIDLQRAEGEGMGQMFYESVSSKEERGNDPLAKFLRGMVDEFEATHSALDVEEVGVSVLAKMGEGERLSVTAAMNDRLEGQRLRVDELGDFLKGEGAGFLRDLLGNFLGEEELGLLEAEEVRRQMIFDRDFRGTPG